METLILKLKHDNPGLTFNIGISSCWSPSDNMILYTNDEHETTIAGLLHEVGHARLEHVGYSYDVELLQKEISAWEEAMRLSRHYNVPINIDHIQDCLDTYRDWVYKRGLCPRCKSTGLQVTETNFRCINCTHLWTVTAARFCRPYRRSK